MTQPISSGNNGIATLTNALRAEHRGTQGAGNGPAADARATRTDQVNISEAGRFQQQQFAGLRGNSKLMTANGTPAQQSGNPADDRLGAAGSGRGERMRALMSDMRAAFYSSAGDDNFNARMDLNGDGTINTGDLAMVRRKMGGAPASPLAQSLAAPPSQEQTQPGNSQRAMMDSMRDAFFSRTGDDNFNADLDMNNDGVINAQDLGDLRRRMDSAATSTLTPSTAPAPSQDQMQTGDPQRALMDSMREAFFSRTGDDNFNADLDMNNDGVINAQDLGDLRRRMDSAATSTVSQSPAPSPSQDQTQQVNSTSASPTTSVDSDGPISEMDQLRNAFFTSAGEDGFNANVDFNGDGVINTQDLGIARMRAQQPTDPVHPNVEMAPTEGQATYSAVDASMVSTAATAPMQDTNTGPILSSVETQATNPNADARAALVEKLRDAFYSSTGDENFIAALDTNGDGQINSADLAAMRERFEADGNSEV